MGDDLYTLGEILNGKKWTNKPRGRGVIINNLVDLRTSHIHTQYNIFHFSCAIEIDISNLTLGRGTNKVEVDAHLQSESIDSSTIRVGFELGSMWFRPIIGERTSINYRV